MCWNGENQETRETGETQETREHVQILKGPLREGPSCWPTRNYSPGDLNAYVVLTTGALPHKSKFACELQTLQYIPGSILELT